MRSSAAILENDVGNIDSVEQKSVEIMFKKLSGISGWLARTDFEIFSELLAHQKSSSYAGSVIEIGTHHGKSFIPLAISNESNGCYVIDVFDNQEVNLDNSGKGDINRFKNNLISFGIDLQNIVIDARMSEEVKSTEIFLSAIYLSF